MRFETIAEQLFFVTVRIETVNHDGSSRLGTGFLYTVPTSATEEATFLVTNKHVVSGAARCSVFYMAGQDPQLGAPILGQQRSVTIEDIPGAFHDHPDPAVDVSIAAVSPWINSLRELGVNVFFRSISPSLALTNENVLELDALEDVVFLGYPLGLYDTNSGLPISRRGVTASPLELDYRGAPVFLIDASVHPGSSGSPVFLFQTGGYSVRNGGINLGSRLIWLGVLAAVYQNALGVEEAPVAQPSIVRSPVNLGIVFKARAVDELCDHILASHGLRRHVPLSQPEVTTPDLGADALDDEGA